MTDGPRDYSVTPIRTSDPGDHHLPPRFHGNGSPVAAGATPRYAAPSRGPSPILPPIRDLQSFADSRPGSQPDAYALSDYRSAPVDAHSPWDRRNAETSYLGSSGPPMMHSHSPYGYPMAYPSDSEQHSPHILSHAHQSNFGIMGDPIDPKNKRRRGNLPKPVTDILRAWFHEHLDHPYPSEEDKQMFMTRTGLSISQVGSILFPFV